MAVITAEWLMKETLVRVGEGGRVVIPATLRKAMGVSIGDELIVRLVDGELRMLTPRQAVRLAQSLVRQFVPKGSRLVDELIEERRKEDE
jgi:AbrB family looped-hinge helix DNA binding protein